MFETVYEVKFLQGQNYRPYHYRAFTPSIRTGDHVVVDVKGGGAGFSGYKLAQVVSFQSLPAHKALQHRVAIVSKVDDADYKEQTKLSNLLAQAARNVRSIEAQVEAAEAAVIDLAHRRAALADARAHEAEVKRLAGEAETTRLRRLDNGGINTPRYWAEKIGLTDEETRYLKGPFPAAPGDAAYQRKTGSALDGAPCPFDDGGWGNC